MQLRGCSSPWAAARPLLAFDSAPNLSHTVACCRRNLPSSLLLLSRAFTVTTPIGGPKKPVVGEDTLRETLATLPDEAIEDAELTATARWAQRGTGW